jgi:hypothetical protein
LPVADIIRRNRRESIDQVLQFPENLGAHAMLMVFKKYSYQRPGTRALNTVGASTFTAQELRGTDSVLVPLPQNIQDSYQVRVQRFDQGIAGEAMASIAAGMNNLGNDPSLGDFGRILAGAIPDIDTDAIRNLDFGSISRDAAFLARRTLDGALPEATRNIDAGFGNTINPKAALYFEGVEMKTHTFNWTFAPASERESTILKNIGTTVKKNILPSYGAVGGVSRLLLNYPSVLDIFFLGVDQSYFLYYKTCMVQQFNIDFTPQGIALLKGGKPAMVTMNMNVIEADIHTSEDYGGSGTWRSENAGNIPPADSVDPSTVPNP